MSFQFERPTTTEALGALLEQAGATASLLAGGTDLLVLLRSRKIQPTVVIDIKRIEELGRLVHHDDGSVTMGATVTCNRVIDDARFQGAMAALPAAASEIANYTIRNRATVVGNVANASPAADMVPALCVLDAQVELNSVQGTRSMSILDYLQGVRKTAARDDEYVSALHIPAPGKGTRTAFRKRKRVKGHDLALTNAAIIRDPERKHLAVCIGACAPVPVMVDLDDMFDEPDAERAAERAMKAIRPIDDVRASAEYRTDMTGVLVRRLFADLGIA